MRNTTFCLLASLLLGAPPAADAAPPTEEVLHVDGDVALSSLMTISDRHIENLVGALRVLAQTSEAQSADWKRIQKPLAEVAKSNVDALNWFVQPDGSYWSVQKGQETGNLKERPYFARLLRGETVIGDLVVSKSTGKSVAIVAIPVLRDKKVVGALGASIYLDRLSARLEKEMDLDETMIFYSFDQKPTVGLDWDPAVIFADPMKLGPEVSKAFREMLTKKEGVVEYSFRGKHRKVIFKKSDLTGWWYAFGIIPEGREKAGKKIG